MQDRGVAKRAPSIKQGDGGRAGEGRERGGREGVGLEWAGGEISGGGAGGMNVGAESRSGYRSSSPTELLETNPMSRFGGDTYAVTPHTPSSTPLGARDRDRHTRTHTHTHKERGREMQSSLVPMQSRS